MRSTNHRITKLSQTIVIPNIVEKVPNPVQLFKGTPYSNSVRPKRPIVPPEHTKTATTELPLNKRQKANPPNIAKPIPKKLMEAFATTLPNHLIKELDNNNGKPHIDKSFTADVVFRHIVPHVLNYSKKSPEAVHSDFFKHLRWNPVLPTTLVEQKFTTTDKKSPDAVHSDFFEHLRGNQVLPATLVEPTFTTTDLKNLQAVTGIIGKYLRLYKRYAHVNTSRARGYATFHQFESETDFNQERIDLYSAALFQKRIQHRKDDTICRRTAYCESSKPTQDPKTFERQSRTRGPRQINPSIYVRCTQLRQRTQYRGEFPEI